MRLRRRSNCAMNSGLIGIPARRYSALTDCYTTGSSGLDRRGSLPASVLRFTPLVKIERKISQFESPRCDVRSLKFDTTIEKTHIKRLLCLVGILVVFTFSAISYSFYKVLKKNYYIWISRMSCNNELIYILFCFKELLNGSMEKRYHWKFVVLCQCICLLVQSFFTFYMVSADFRFTENVANKKKTHQYEGAMKLMILVLEDNQLTKQNQKTNRNYCWQLMCSAVLLMYFLPTYLFYFVQ